MGFWKGIEQKSVCFYAKYIGLWSTVILSWMFSFGKFIKNLHWLHMLIKCDLVKTEKRAFI